MPKVHEDIAAGNTGKLSFNGWEFNRVFIVSELVTVGYNKLIEATGTSGVPQMDDSHPSIADAYVVDVQPDSTPGATDIVTLNITYRQFTPNVIVNVGSRSVTSELNAFFTDQAAGTVDFMKLGYTYPTGHLLEGQTDTQGVVLQVAEEFPQFTYARTEWLTNLADAESGYPIGIQLTGNHLSDRSKLFNTALNSTVWNVKPNDPVKTWQCRISAVSSGNGFDWRVSYTFSFDLKEWTYTGIYIDPTNNQPVPDPSFTLPSPDPSAKDFAMYRTANFNLLGIT